jgi:hypothetical protein
LIFSPLRFIIFATLFHFSSLSIRHCRHYLFHYFRLRWLIFHGFDADTSLPILRLLTIPAAPIVATTRARYFACLRCRFAAAAADFASFALMFSPPRLSLPATFRRHFRFSPPMPAFDATPFFFADYFLSPITLFLRRRHFDAIFIFARAHY